MQVDGRNALMDERARTVWAPAPDLRLEHEHDAGILRIVGAGHVEVGVGDLAERLRLSEALPHPSPCFLLFAGGPKPAGGAGDLIGTFTAEAEARNAFVDVRRSTTDSEAWAEVVALTVGASVQQVCWFGPPTRVHHGGPWVGSRPGSTPSSPVAVPPETEAAFPAP